MDIDNSAYTLVSNIQDNTIIAKDFGNDFKWRPVKSKEELIAEQNAQHEAANTACDRETYTIRVISIISHFWFFLAFPILGYMSGSGFVGFMAGIIPYTVMVIYSTIRGCLDESGWFILPIIILSPIGWLWMFGFYTIIGISIFAIGK